MRLPAGYLDIVADGVAVLRTVGDRLRANAERAPHVPELWLSVRDVEGLASRMDGLDDRAWEEGFADMLINGQDIGVLDELLGVGASNTAHAARRVTGAEAERLGRLRHFLQRYIERDFELDDPAA